MTYIYIYTYISPRGGPRFSGLGYVAQVLQRGSSASLWGWGPLGSHKSPRHGPFGGHVGWKNRIPLSLRWLYIFINKGFTPMHMLRWLTTSVRSLYGCCCAQVTRNARFLYGCCDAQETRSVRFLYGCCHGGVTRSVLFLDPVL